ncbi:MAG: DsbA family protein [Acidobacteriota bacterium]
MSVLRAVSRRRVSDASQELRRDRRVLLAFRHLPLENRHPSALRAAQAADCSGRQGRFWPMHDELFRTPRALGMDSLIAKGKQIGLDMSAFRRCLTAETTETLQRDIASARELSITGTPTFLIGMITAEGRLKVSRHQSGAIPKEVLSRILDDLLRTAAPQ